jgi:hypothetical protein
MSYCSFFDMDIKALKINVIASIISSLVILIFIQPILSFVWKAVVAVAGFLHQGYVDRIYLDAALPDRNLIGWTTLLLLIMFFLFGTLTLLVGRVPFPPPSGELPPSSVNKISRFIRVSLCIEAILFSSILIIALSLSSGIM